MNDKQYNIPKSNDLKNFIIKPNIIKKSKKINCGVLKLNQIGIFNNIDRRNRQSDRRNRQKGGEIEAFKYFNSFLQYR